MSKCRCYLYCDLTRCQAYHKLPRLPLEIWLMILKIKRWTDRCTIVKRLHQEPHKMLVRAKTRRLFSEEEEEFIPGATGWIESYYFHTNFTTHHYCTLTYPHNQDERDFEKRILRREGKPHNYVRVYQPYIDCYYWGTSKSPFITRFYFNKVG